jgi:predicted RNase H-like HicB family nuclease
MRQRTYTVLIEQDETGAYIAKVPDLQGCHTHARSIPELLKRVREAIELCLEVEGKDTQPLRFIGVQQVSIPA